MACRRPQICMPFARAMAATLPLSAARIVSLARTSIARAPAPRTFCAAAASSPLSHTSLPHSDLSYRALLRNLRLLSGMRETPSRVLVLGNEATAVARQMGALEASAKFVAAGDGLSVDAGAC